MAELTPEQRSALEPLGGQNSDREPGCFSSAQTETLAAHFLNCITYFSIQRNGDRGVLNGASAGLARKLIKIKKVQCIKEGLFYAHWVIDEIPGDPTGSEDQNWDRFQKRKEEYLEAWRMAVEEFPFDIVPIPTKRSESEVFELMLTGQALHDPSPFGRYSGARKRARGFRKRQIKRLIRRLIKWIITRLDTFLKRLN